MMNTSRNWDWQVLAAKKKLLTYCVLGLFLLAIGMDLRAELGAGHNQKKMSKRDTATTGDAAIWQPAAGVKWQIQLIDAVEDTTVDADIWDIDLFDNSAETIATLQGKGHKVICYFSAGTSEDWRSDFSKFNTADFGSNMDEWPGERWLNIKSTTVRSIMTSRLDLAQQKGCDGVDPDNIDAYGNENGLGLTEADSIDFLNFLASEAHARGMAIGLKNGGDIIGSVIDKMQWSVNEQCAEYNECDTYAAFTEVNKPVFHIEYSDETIEVDSSASSDNAADTTTEADSDDEAPTATTSPSASASAPASAPVVTSNSAETDVTGAGTVDSITDASTGANETTDDEDKNEEEEEDREDEDDEKDEEDEADEEDEGDEEDEDDEKDEEDEGDEEDNEDEDDKEDKEECDGAKSDTGRKQGHRFRHGEHKLRARAVLSSTLKNSACNAASADKFSTVIKNMNLDAWVEYC